MHSTACRDRVTAKLAETSEGQRRIAAALSKLDVTAEQLENSHRKALEALNSLTSEKETSLDGLILVIKGLNIIRLELGEELDIDDDSESPLADDSNHYRLWMIFQYLGQLLFQCVEELERNF